jgi:uncharacterized Zn-binding protein involved in type VI secretion
VGQPAAKMGDQVVAVDIHIIMVPTPGGPVPTPLPHPFVGMLNGALSTDVMIMGRPAATKDSKATAVPPHIPLGGGPFQKPPSNQGTIMMGSTTVMINGKPAARVGDPVMTCNDPTDLPVGQIVAASTVLIG